MTGVQTCALPILQKGVSADVKPAHDATVGARDTLVIFAEHEKLLGIAARNRNGH